MVLLIFAMVFVGNGMWTSPEVIVGGYQGWQRGIFDGHLTEAAIELRVWWIMDLVKQLGMEEERVMRCKRCVVLSSRTKRWMTVSQMYNKVLLLSMNCLGFDIVVLLCCYKIVCVTIRDL